MSDPVSGHAFLIIVTLCVFLVVRLLTLSQLSHIRSLSIHCKFNSWLLLPIDSCFGLLLHASDRRVALRLSVGALILRGIGMLLEDRGNDQSDCPQLINNRIFCLYTSVEHTPDARV